MSDRIITEPTLQKIADELPGEWTAERIHDYGGRLTREDGLKLFAYVDHTGQGYMMADVVREHLRYDEKTPEIGLKLTKKGAAADIARRLLEDAERIHRVVAGRQALAGVAKVHRDEARARLELTGAVRERSEYDRDDTELRIYAGEVWGQARLRHSGNGLSQLELHGLTLEQAEEILSLLGND